MSESEIPVGTWVQYWTGVREGDGKISRTRTTVRPLGGEGGTPVVWVEGEGSCISMTHVQMIDAVGLAEILTRAERFLDSLRTAAAELLAETEASGAATPEAETNPNPTA